MSKHLFKPLNQQVIVITGASSGIGLATARRAAREGSRLLLASRHEEALRDICRDIKNAGGEAIYVVADVGEPADMQRIADTAIETFGGFDTWVNNAGVVIFSELKDLPVDEHQRLFQTNYWGVVHGSHVAAEHFKQRIGGGTLINVASINSEMPVPILGAYSASKAAVKAFSEVLRMELMNEKAPVKVSIIMPSGISTPISEHARSHMKDQGKVLPPMYDVELVASTILKAAIRPVRNITVGETGRLSMLAWSLLPTLMDHVISRTLPKAQSSGKPKLPHDNLFAPVNDGEVYVEGKRQGIPVSPYTQARLHPAISLGVGLLAAGAIFACTRKRS
jgi:short-subunit dehydrogenase